MIIIIKTINVCLMWSFNMLFYKKNSIKTTCLLPVKAVMQNGFSGTKFYKIKQDKL